eukprot:TRINITY_DN1762_c0_g1_i3.p1 TRINITY_DN1762_c0_g1~~TRINITY_DN1762_c0_g1_i3.p1  ORF type:complete len:412 (-),score=90.41 TRINITY_DN1762_c0_g1_i3:712-1947(-)
MGRAAFGRGDTSNVNKAQAPAPTFECSACAKKLPRSAFAKAELNRGGSGRCRDCGNRTQCKGCQQLLLPTQLDSKSICRKCRENTQVDRFLQTPKDEITHFGVEKALRLDKEAEHELLLSCHKCGLCERMVLQNILDFLRVPFVTTQNGMHFCELCDETFSELAVAQGQKVRMLTQCVKIDWADCPGPRLTFHVSETYTISELVKTAKGRWFFRTLAKPPKKPELKKEPTPGHDSSADSTTVSESAAASPDKFSPPDRTEGSTSSAVPKFESFWAPLDATEEGRQTSPLIDHLKSNTHSAHEAAVNAGEKILISRAALKLARENPGSGEANTAFSRFRDGLSIAGRFCEPRQVELAKKLERIRDVGIPVQFLRDLFPSKQSFLWISPEELWEAEEKYEKRAKKGQRKRAGS